MYQDGHRRAMNQSNWSNASTVHVQKVRGQTYYVPPNFQVGARSPCSYAPVCGPKLWPQENRVLVDYKVLNKNEPLKFCSVMRYLLCKSN